MLRNSLEAPSCPVIQAVVENKPLLHSWVFVCLHEVFFTTPLNPQVESRLLAPFPS